MCLRLSNRRHCLTLASILGILQTLVGLPITILSFIVFAWTSLGAALSPFWCGLVVLMTGVVGILVRPTRLAPIIFAHVILNVLSICACFLSAGITGLYGTAVQLPAFPQLDVTGTNTTSPDCIFSPTSPLYTESFRETFFPLDSLVDSCTDLEEFWTYLIAIMSLSVMALIISIVAVVSNCITPCVEDRYSNQWSADKTDV